MAFPNQKNKAAQGPDPEVMGAIQRLQRTELDPLQEVMFQSWANANQIDDPDAEDNTFDFRKTYQDMNGKVMPPGELKAMAEKESALQILMRAQEEHEKNSPLKLFQEALSMGQGGEEGTTGGGQDMDMAAQAPQGMPDSSQGPESGMPPMGAMDQMMGAGGGY